MTGELIGQTKRWMAKQLCFVLVAIVAKRLRATYQIPSSIQIMIPRLSAKDNDPPTEG